MKSEGQVICTRGSEILNRLILKQESLIENTIEDIKSLNKIIPNFAFSELLKTNSFKIENETNEDSLKTKASRIKKISL